MTEDDAQRLAEQVTVLRAQAGDREAFHALVEQYQPRLMYYVRRLITAPDDCQDVLQEIWLQAFRSLGRLQSPAAFRVWLYQLAYRRAATHRRRHAEPLQLEATGAMADSVDAWDELAMLDNAELVHHALAHISAAHREVLMLRFLEEMDVAEISEVLGCSLGTTKSRLHYAKRALREVLDGDDHAGRA